MPPHVRGLQCDGGPLISQQETAYSERPLATTGYSLY